MRTYIPFHYLLALWMGKVTVDKVRDGLEFTLK